MKTPDDLKSIDAKLDDILKSATSLKDEAEAYSALADLVATTFRINALFAPSQGAAAAPETAFPDPVVTSLQRWIQKMKGALEALAKFLEAVSYTIGVSVPLGLSVLMSFSA